MGKDVIIACDFDNAKDTLEFLDKASWPSWTASAASGLTLR